MEFTLHLDHSSTGNTGGKTRLYICLPETSSGLFRRQRLWENGEVTVTLSNREGKMQRQINLSELELKELQ